MPNLWMHIEYGRWLKAELQDCLLFSDNFGEWRVLYQLGCQGPDYLFYYGFLPWKKEIKAARLGDLIHSRHCGQVLMEFWDRVLLLPPKERVPATAYFAGFLTHHLVDRNLHPYINWKAGYKHRDHQRFEVLLDTVFIRWLNGGNTWKMPGWKEIDAGTSLPSGIVDILHNTALAHFPEVGLGGSLPRYGACAALAV